MTDLEFIKKLTDISENYRTLYATGGFGAPAGYGRNRTRYTTNYEYNKREYRKNKILNCPDDTFLFDCVGLIKAILWGWHGDISAVYGGAIYKSNGVSDVSVNGLLNMCTDVSSNFESIVPGELLWMPGHVGIYIGNGLAVECTPSWSDGVQITAVNKIIDGYHRRNWIKHGKLPYIVYSEDPKDPPAESLYIVKRGDTLSKIAKAYDTTYQQLAEYNGISDPNIIHVGQKIRIPEADSCEITLKLGDTVELSSNATVYGKTKRFSPWVYSATLYVREIDGDRIKVSTLKKGAITGSVHKKHLIRS